jgi:Protein of unknown function (DUF3251)
VENIRLLAAAILTTLLVATGCNTQQSKSQPPNKVNDPLQQQKNEIQALRDRVNRLQIDLLRLQHRVSQYESASLDPTEKGYERIDTASGLFLISVVSAEPYLDGYRLHLQIGNLTTARYKGFKLTLTWQKPWPEQKSGESDEDFQKRLDEAEKAEPREKEISFTETLYPSSWNTVSVIVSPATTEELKELQISSMVTNQVSLGRR